MGARTLMTRARLGAAVAAVACVAGLSTSSAAPRGDAKGETLGFLVTKFAVAIYYGDFATDCPEGFSPTTDEQYLLTQKPAERARLLKPENAPELEKKWKIEYTSGPNGEDICRNPRSFLDDPRHPVQKTVQGKISYGMNLDGTEDGRATARSCKHEKFRNPEGELVDNQLYRIMGCAKSWRGEGATFGGSMALKYNSYMKDGLHNYLIELRGVNDRRNDDDVEVGIYSTDDKSLLDGAREHLPNQTFAVTANPRWRNVVHGRIVDGVLTTDVIDTMYLNWFFALNGPYGAVNEHEFRQVHFRLTLEKNGILKGIMGGYQPIEITSAQARNGGKGVATNGNRDCASEYKSMAAFADGYPDENGQCTMISLAQDVEAIPAFVLHPEAARAQTAALP